MVRTASIAAMIATFPLLAVPPPDAALNCSGKDWDYGNRQRFCEMRETLLPAAQRVLVDGRKNGGVSVKGWDQPTILVRAKVQTWAPSAGEAQAIASQVTVATAGAAIRSDAPDFGSGRGWAVSSKYSYRTAQICP